MIFQGLSKMFGSATLGDYGSLLGGVAALVGVSKKEDMPDAPSYDEIKPPGVPENAAADLAEQRSDARKRSRQSSRAKKKVSLLSDSNISATSLV